MTTMIIKLRDVILRRKDKAATIDSSKYHNYCNHFDEGFSVEAAMIPLQIIGL